METSERTKHMCRNCIHSTKTPGHVQHYKIGLRNCSLLPDHHFVAGHHTCSRWTAKALENETEHA